MNKEYQVGSAGFLLWMLGPVALLQSVLRRSVAVGAAGLGLLGGYLLYGLMLDLLFPWIHRLVQSRLDEQ